MEPQIFNRYVFCGDILLRHRKVQSIGKDTVTHLGDFFSQLISGTFFFAIYRINQKGLKSFATLT